MKIYCSGCGSSNSYASKKPNFCQNCGNPLNSAVKTTASTITPKPKGPSSLRTLGEEDYDDEVEMPDIDRLEVEIESGKIQGMQFGNVIGTVNPDDIKNQGGGLKPKKPKRLSKKAQQAATNTFLKNFQKEAGTNRRSDATE